MKPTAMPRFAIICACIGLALSLAACGPSASEADRAAHAFCADHGGVRNIDYVRATFPYAAYSSGECQDGSKFE